MVIIFPTSFLGWGHQNKTDSVQDMNETGVFAGGMRTGERGQGALNMENPHSTDPLDSRTHK